MKLSKHELKQRISDAITDDEELVISLLEDIEDSMDENNESIIDETKVKELEELKWKYNDLLLKYKERFLQGTKSEEESEEENEEEIGVEKKEVIDVKEI